MSKANKSNKTSCHDNNTSFAILNSTDNRSTNSPYRSPFISSSTSWENLNLTCFRHIVFPCWWMTSLWNKCTPLKFMLVWSQLNMHFCEWARVALWLATRVGKMELFTITTKIHARSLVNFYCQYADRYMNLKFISRVSEREWAIRQFVIVKNKLMSVLMCLSCYWQWILS